MADIEIEAGDWLWTGEIVGSVVRQEGNMTIIEPAEFPPPALVKMEMDRILALMVAAGFVEVSTAKVRTFGE